MGKILIFIYEGMADFEITFVTNLLGVNLGKEIITIGYEDELIKSNSGIEYIPSKLIKDVLEYDIEGLIIPGGNNVEVRAEIINLIQNLNAKGKVLGAICAGPRFLAKAGVLDNAKYTTSLVKWTEDIEKHFNESDPFPRHNFILDRVVRDGNIITSQGHAFIDFAIEICDWFGYFEDEDDKNGFIKVIKGI